MERYIMSNKTGHRYFTGMHC